MKTAKKYASAEHVASGADYWCVRGATTMFMLLAFGMRSLAIGGFEPKACASND